MTTKVLSMLADASAADPLWIQNFWVVVVVPTVTSGGTWLMLKLAQKRNVTGQVEVTQNPPLATKADLAAVEVRLEGRMTKVESAIEAERGVAREGLGRVHGRIDRVAERLAELGGKMDETNKNVRTLLEHQVEGGRG